MNWCRSAHGRRHVPPSTQPARWHGDAGGSLRLIHLFPCALLSLCEILPQKDREILRVRSDVRGEQAGLCRALQGDWASPAQAVHRGSLCLLRLEAARRRALSPAVGTLRLHLLTSLLPLTLDCSQEERPAPGTCKHLLWEGAEQDHLPTPQRQRSLSDISSS